jgi:hypothetical protein
MTAEALNTRYVTALVDIALNARLARETQRVSVCANEIEDDGRKAIRAAREMFNAGFIATAPKTAIERVGVNVQAVLATLTPVKPTLAIADHQRTSVIEGRLPVGCAVKKFAHAELLYLLDHVNDYRWFWVEQNNTETDWAPGQPLPEHSWRHALHVSDQALRDDLSSAQRAVKVAALMKQNAGWALEKLAKLDEATVKTFAGIGSMGFGRGEDSFSGDPATWAETARRYTERAEAKLVAAQAQVDAARAIADKLIAYGGWGKLATDLLVKVEAHINGTETDDDKEEA